MSIRDHYLSLLEKSQDVFKAVLKDDHLEKLLCKAHNYVQDYETLAENLGSRPERQMLSLAVREYQWALYAVAIGNYRHANISLRLFFELSLASVHFSANEIKLRRWMIKSNDVAWSSLIELENGVYAKSFISAFTPQLQDFGRQYSTIAERVHRECSEFVHGNLHTHKGLDNPIELDKGLLEEWIERSETVRLSFIFAFAARYLGLMSDSDKQQIEPIMLESLGHIPAVQAFYDK